MDAIAFSRRKAQNNEVSRGFITNKEVDRIIDIDKSIRERWSEEKKEVDDDLKTLNLYAKHTFTSLKEYDFYIALGGISQAVSNLKGKHYQYMDIVFTDICSITTGKSIFIFYYFFFFKFFYFLFFFFF